MGRGQRRFALIVLALWALLAGIGFLVPRSAGPVDADARHREFDRLRQELLQLAEENRVLRAQLEVQENFSARFPVSYLPHPARLTPLPDLTPRRRSALLDAGREDGVREGQGVVSDLGIVGRVARSGARSSRLCLADDPAFRVHFRAADGLAEGVLQGGPQPGERRVLLRRDTEPLVEGELLITAGHDGVFPPGIVIGQVERVGADHAATRVRLVENPWIPEVVLVLKFTVDVDVGYGGDR